MNRLRWWWAGLYDGFTDPFDVPDSWFADANADAISYLDGVEVCTRLRRFLGERQI